MHSYFIFQFLLLECYGAFKDYMESNILLQKFSVIIISHSRRKTAESLFYGAKVMVYMECLFKRYLLKYLCIFY